MVGDVHNWDLSKWCWCPFHEQGVLTAAHIAIWNSTHFNTLSGENRWLWPCKGDAFEVLTESWSPKGRKHKQRFVWQIMSPHLCGYLNLNNQMWICPFRSQVFGGGLGWIVAECCRCKTAASEGATGHQRCLGALAHGATWRQKWRATSSMTKRSISLLSVWSSTSFSLGRRRSAFERFMTWWAGSLFPKGL